jgi:membrane protease YdiL (CAAX protease family)
MSNTPDNSPKPASWSEIGGVYLLSIALIGVILLVGQGPLKEYRGGLVGAVYLFLPTFICRRQLLAVEEYAPLERPSPRAILLPLGFALLFFPLFWFVGGWLGLVAPFRSLALPDEFGLLLLTQFLVVALPEELFFRGYIQRRMDDLLPPRWRLFGVTVGPSLVLSSVCFALAHFVSPPNPARLLTFFPGLAFAFLRAATGGVWAGVLFHGLCNLYVEVLSASSR